MLACYLLFSGEAKSAAEAVQTYAELRTEDGKVCSLPLQTHDQNKRVEDGDDGARLP